MEEKKEEEYYIRIDERKKTKNEIIKDIKNLFIKMTQQNINGEYKYWDPLYFGYSSHDMDCSTDKYFPQELCNNIINLIEYYE